MGKQFCSTCVEDQEVYVNGPGGTSVCTGCGLVLEENAIVSEISFGETGGGAATVNGSHIGLGETRARVTGGYKQGGGQESREQTLYNGKKKLLSLANGLNLSERISDAGNRYFNLAVNMNFVQGRRTEYVVAACLYSACRFNKTSHMLIDFSDLLQINVFVLGSTYLKLVKELSLNLPTIDPSLYISRFAALLEFGDETQKVAADAVRLVSRMGRDWMHIGRRPAGVCGACLLLAARMNNFRRSITEVVQVVKIADVTLRKRLGEFKITASGGLTVDEFRTVWLEEQADPPAYSQSVKRDTKDREKAELLSGMLESVEEEEEDEEERTVVVKNISEKKKGKRKERPEEVETEEQIRSKRSDKILAEPAIDDMITATLLETLDTTSAKALSDELKIVEDKRKEKAQGMTNLNELSELNTSERLDDLDEAELDCFLLTEAEVEAKSRLWMEFNKDYLQALADKQTGPDGELKVVHKPKPRKKTKFNPGDPAPTAAEATKAMMVKKRFSKKINYNAIDDLFKNDNVADGKKKKKEKQAPITIARPTFPSSRSNSRAPSMEPSTQFTTQATQARPNDTQDTQAEEEPAVEDDGDYDIPDRVEKVVEEEEEDTWRKEMGMGGNNDDEEDFGYDGH